ncbi:MAG: 3,4-dihydroxyphenylacetate 2,3-dioxygenase [Anaerolineae bacterium]
MALNIVRAAHAEVRVTDLGRAQTFYVDVLGFVETARDAERIYLRGYEEREHHSLILRHAASPGLGHIAFHVASSADLDELARLYASRSLAHCWVEAGEERGQGEALRVQDPCGLPVEFYHDMQPAERLLRRYDLQRGARVMRLDHFNVQAPDVRAAYAWYHDNLGFWLSEYTETEGPEARLWSAYLRRKQTVHDIAVMSGAGPRLHHIGFAVREEMDILRACDILAAAGYGHAIERGPGRHGLTNALFLYLRDPDGNRIELCAGDYLVSDPDQPPQRWSINDPRRSTFWGHTPPASWFNDAALVEDILTGELLPTSPTTLQDRPDFIT